MVALQCRATESDQNAILRQHDGRRIASQSRKPLSPPGRIRLWCWPTGPTLPLGRLEEKGLITFNREAGTVQLAPEPQNISPTLGRGQARWVLQ